MYPSHNSTKAIHEARVRELHEDVQVQASEQIIFAGLWARLRRWLAARRARRDPQKYETELAFKTAS